MNGGSEATRILREEHVWILRVADVLERLLDAEAASGTLDVQSADDCVRFIRLFADACHHGKEEDLLFTELEKVGFSRESGPVAVMLHEHRQGRELARRMAEALDDHGSGDSGAARRFVSAANGYIQLIRGHILKEDNVLFEMADRTVTGPACERLCTAYDGVCARRFEGCTKTELEALVTVLTERYPAPSV